jgi:hypothetical protein
VGAGLVLFAGISAALFVCWFRYTCGIMLSTKTAENYARGVAHANRLCFLDVQKDMPASNYEMLREFRYGLSSDYRKLNSLLDQALEAEGDQLAIERTILEADFHCMSMLFFVAGRCSDRVARQALVEMSQIVEHHANVIGERSAIGAIQ